MNLIDTRRHEEVFSSHAFGKRRIDVIGAGATGSRIVPGLAKLGIENIRVWDFDSVESHNVANQAYSQADIGKTKLDALAELVKAHSGLEIVTKAERVDGTQELGDIVFLLTDTMSSRKEIWTRGIRFKSRTKLMIETRMGKDQGRVYVINPMKPAQVKGWEGTLYDDEAAEVSACGTRITVGATAEFLSGLAQHQLIRWQAVQQGREDNLDHEIIFALDPPTFMTRRFD